MVKRLFFISLFLFTYSIIGGEAFAQTNVLKTLIDSANIELKSVLEVSVETYECYSRESKDAAKQSHLELRQDSVVYVGVFSQKNLDELLNIAKDFKTEMKKVNLILYQSSPLNPHFKQLIDHLIKTKKSLYLVYTTPDKYKTTDLIEFTFEDLKEFGQHCE